MHLTHEDRAALLMNFSGRNSLQTRLVIIKVKEAYYKYGCCGYANDFQENSLQLADIQGTTSMWRQVAGTVVTLNVER